MTPEQIAAARDAARIVVAFGPHDDEGNVSPSYVACEVLLWLTDPTPLTWELVVAEGFSQIEGAPQGAINCVCGCVTLACWPQHNDQVEQRLGRAIWEMERNEWTIMVEPQPRTLGELRQLMIRVGGEAR